MASTEACAMARLFQQAKSPVLVESGTVLPFDAMIVVHEGFEGFAEAVTQAGRRVFLARQRDWKVINIVVKFYHTEINVATGQVEDVYEELSDYEKDHVGIVFALRRGDENFEQVAMPPVEIYVGAGERRPAGS